MVLKHYPAARVSLRIGCLLAAILLFALPAASQAAAVYKIMPETVRLTGPAAEQQVIVMRVEQGELTGQPQKVEWQTSNPKIAIVKAGRVYPRGNGTARLTAVIGKTKTSVKVQVEKYEQPQAWSFRNHVQSVLSKTGCNSGACHGAAAGKNGFKLSLRGYDSAFDYLAITRQAGGRRIVPSDPGRSLLLTQADRCDSAQRGAAFQNRLSGIPGVVGMVGGWTSPAGSGGSPDD